MNRLLTSVERTSQEPSSAAGKSLQLQARRDCRRPYHQDSSQDQR